MSAKVQVPHLGIDRGSNKGLHIQGVLEKDVQDTETQANSAFAN